VKRLPKRAKVWQETPKGMEIPVPKRKDFLRDLTKAAKPKSSDELGKHGG